MIHTLIITAILLSTSCLAATNNCNIWCGYTSVLNPAVGASGSVDESAYYFYNGSYAPSVYITSNATACPLTLLMDGNTLTINGTFVAFDGSNAGFFINYLLSATNGSNPLLELKPSQYVENGGTVNPADFSYWSLTQGTLTGYGTYQGVVLTMSEFMHPLMIGNGANGKNLNFGSGGWFSHTSNGITYQTDLNIDLSAAICSSDVTCSSHGSCNADGTCSCFTGFVGPNCNQCDFGYYNYPSCVACNADINCTSHGACNVADGSCTCDIGFTGTNCDQCASGYSGYPSCSSDVGVITTPTSTPVSGANAVIATSYSSLLVAAAVAVLMMLFV